MRSLNSLNERKKEREAIEPDDSRRYKKLFIYVQAQFECIFSARE